jgi:hypothetical protein
MEDIGVRAKKFCNALIAVIMLGLVDTVEDDWASAEVTDPAGNVEYMELPVDLFPCKIKEGDMFYAVTVDGVTEIRCGEPPD